MNLYKQNEEKNAIDNNRQKRFLNKSRIFFKYHIYKDATHHYPLADIQ